MKNSTLLLTSILALGTAPALAAITTGQVIGTSEPMIRAALESNGYIIESIEVDGDEIEVETMFNGKPVEIELSADTGAVTEIENESDDEQEDEADGYDDDDN